MSEGRIDLNVQGHVAQVTIDDVARHNAMSLSMWTALLAAFEEIDRRTDVRVCVLRGAGEKSFVSGANISEFETQRNSEASVAHYNDMVKRTQQAIFRCRVPVIAGCGSNDTRNALLHMNFSRKAGAAAGLCVAPYYNRPSQRGLIAHFSYLAENCDLPIVLYNVPARTVTDLLDETVVELVRKYPDRIIAIKDASGDLSRVADHRMGIGREFCQLSGNDDFTKLVNGHIPDASAFSREKVFG